MLNYKDTYVCTSPPSKDKLSTAQKIVLLILYGCVRANRKAEERIQGVAISEKTIRYNF